MHQRHLRPIKPFVIASFTNYLMQFLADPEVELLSKQACDDAVSNIGTPPDKTTNIFDAKFMKLFKGPVPGQLFVDWGDKVRIAFAMHVDFFNSNTGTYLPSWCYPRTKECDLEQINHFIRPIMDQLEIGWKHGFHILCTADSPERGKDVEVAVALSINDLPAARKVSGTAGHGANFYCTVCDGYKCCNIDAMEAETSKPQTPAFHYP
ncbi:hypothetical protein Hypma_010458 [Hypsizygus marmoreus]|uniref:Uncharacterized protein n=1 Tax=Hypsizygus marmoreus TaxID=39966 RepID=A0A369K9F0_HYPMA|nr:hypothetical protein Hypma_010458 [Hypsizygus marmoreus]